MKKFGDGPEAQKLASLDENIDVAFVVFIFMITYLITFDRDTSKIFQ
jgi:hypothetical protein